MGSKIARIKIDIPTFVKWAGGKNKLINQFKKHLPTKINRYFEPFIGGGAVFFYMKQVYKPKGVVISDINHILIELYKNVKENTDILIELLKIHKRNHDPNEKEYYYLMRDKFNKLDNTIEKSALFLYLNKTCFNGLYRVNSKGDFNVPMGSYKNPNIVKAKDIKKASRLLQNIKIKEQDFTGILNNVEKGDFIYLDPPYHPISDSSSFTSYSKEDFGRKDQERLAEFCKKLNKKQVKFMLSNSNTDFIKKLYKDFKIKYVKTRRYISADPKKRKNIKELVAVNY